MPTIEELTTPMRRERDVSKIAGTLRSVANARFDFVAPQSALRMNDNADGINVLLDGDEPILTPTGVVSGEINAAYTRTAFRQINERLGIPLSFADRLVTGEYTHRWLAATNVNTLAGLDTRRALYRMLDADDGMVLRSLLSDRYGLLDNDAALSALLTGLGEEDLHLNDCEVEGDITPDRLRLRIAVPGIELAVPDLLGDYRMPFSMREDRPSHAPPETGEVPPVLWAGLEIANSETGHGTFTVSPRAVVRVCRNGLTRDVAFKRAHIGAALEDGAIKWSDDTRRNVLTLITSQVTDAVREFVSVSYLESVADEMRAAKGVVIDSASTAVQVVTSMLTLTETEATDVFDCFARGGDSTVLGVAQAVTAAAQMVADGDRQSELEAGFWQIVNAPRAFAQV